MLPLTGMTALPTGSTAGPSMVQAWRMQQPSLHWINGCAMQASRKSNEGLQPQGATLKPASLFLAALQAVGYAILALLVQLSAAWRALNGVCASAAAWLVEALPALRPLLAAVVALPPGEHVGSRPRPPSVLGVVVAEEVGDADWASAVEALGCLLAW